MKNAIYIDIDTEREQPILIGKGPEIEPPTSREEAGKMIITDIACICDAMISLMHVAHQNEYGLKEELVATAIGQLNRFLELPSQPKPENSNDSPEPTTPDNNEKA
jgi:hypothetical protein